MAESVEKLKDKTEEVGNSFVNSGALVACADNCATLENSVCTSNAITRKTESQVAHDSTTSSYLTLNASTNTGNTTATTTTQKLEKEAVASLSGLGDSGGGSRRPLSVEVDEDGNHHHPSLTAFSAVTKQGNTIGGSSLSDTISTSPFSTVSGLNNSTVTATTATTAITSEEECNNSLASHCVPQSSGLVFSSSLVHSVHQQPPTGTHQQKIEPKNSSNRNYRNNITNLQQNNLNPDLVLGGGGESDAIVEHNHSGGIGYQNSIGGGCVDNNHQQQKQNFNNIQHQQQTSSPSR